MTWMHSLLGYKAGCRQSERQRTRGAPQLLTYGPTAGSGQKSPPQHGLLKGGAAVGLGLAGDGGAAVGRSRIAVLHADDLLVPALLVVQPSVDVSPRVQTRPFHVETVLHLFDADTDGVAVFAAREVDLQVLDLNAGDGDRVIDHPGFAEFPFHAEDLDVEIEIDAVRNGPQRAPGRRIPGRGLGLDALA